MGSRREARKAGIMPLINPTAPRMRVEAIRVPGAMISRMSPASPFLAKALSMQTRRASGFSSSRKGCTSSFWAGLQACHKTVWSDWPISFKFSHSHKQPAWLGPEMKAVN